MEPGDRVLEGLPRVRARRARCRSGLMSGDPRDEWVQDRAVPHAAVLLASVALRAGVR